jgi:sulfatase maturation enzyme AslB (radical SAM superfamily)
MKYPIKIMSTQPINMVEVRWQVSNLCNFKCAYCFPDSNTGTNRGPTDLNILVNNFNHLFKEYKKKLKIERFNLSITGGEPTVWPKFGNFIERIQTKNKMAMTLISNGSRTLRWWERYGNYVDNTVLSFHAKEGKKEHHLSVANTLTNFGKRVTIMVLMDPTAWDKCIEAIEFFKSNSDRANWFLNVSPLVSTPSFKVDYTKEQLNYLNANLSLIPTKKWINTNLHAFINGEMRVYTSIVTYDDYSKQYARSSHYLNKGINNFAGWQCNLGVESIYIHHDGSLMGGCGQKLFGLDHTYNIYDKDFVKCSIDFKPVICSIALCTCQPETHISKQLLL